MTDCNHDLDKLLDKINSILPMSYEELRDNYSIIGQGTNRTVFDLRNGYVLKVSYSSNVDNVNEWNVWNSVPEHLKELLAPCYYNSDYPDKIIMPLADKVEFKDLVSFVYELEGQEKALAVSNGIYQLTEQYGLVYVDLIRSMNWGIINGKCKLIDYGLTFNS